MLSRRLKGFIYNRYKDLLNLYGVPLHLPFDEEGDDANILIRKRLEADEPCMICRFGENELRTVVAYLNTKFKVRANIKGWLRRESFDLGDERVKNWMFNVAGFFPNDKKSLADFAELMLNDMSYVDILGSWLPRELRVKDYLNKDVKAIPLVALDPWEYDNPWTSALTNKRVLVIHPFEDTIKKQYLNRKFLFTGKNVLPVFNLKTLKAVQSVAGNNSGYATWFDALDDMCGKINTIDFDIAIIGAGAYGFPIAAHVKRIGKKSVHMGGVSQLLFGIKGNRWDTEELGKRLYNKYWVRPLETEKPENLQKVEGGSYW